MVALLFLQYGMSFKALCVNDMQNKSDNNEKIKREIVQSLVSSFRVWKINFLEKLVKENCLRALLKRDNH